MADQNDFSRQSTLWMCEHMDIEGEDTFKYAKRVLQMTTGKIHNPGGLTSILNINPSILRCKMKKLGGVYARGC